MYARIITHAVKFKRTPFTLNTRVKPGTCNT